jgi:hypothetical protein
MWIKTPHALALQLPKRSSEQLGFKRTLAFYNGFSGDELRQLITLLTVLATANQSNHCASASSTVWYAWEHGEPRYMELALHDETLIGIV